MSIRSALWLVLFTWTASYGHPVNSSTVYVATTPVTVRIGYQKLGASFLLEERAESLRAAPLVFAQAVRAGGARSAARTQLAGGAPLTARVGSAILGDAGERKPAPAKSDDRQGAVATPRATELWPTAERFGVGE